VHVAITTTAAKIPALRLFFRVSIKPPEENQSIADECNLTTFFLSFVTVAAAGLQQRVFPLLRGVHHVEEGKRVPMGSGKKETFALKKVSLKTKDTNKENSLELHFRWM